MTSPLPALAEECLGFLRDYGFAGPHVEKSDFSVSATFSRPELAVRAFHDTRDGVYEVDVIKRVRGMTPEPSASVYYASPTELLAAAGVRRPRPARESPRDTICGDAEILRGLEELLRGDLTLFERAIELRTHVS